MKVLIKERDDVVGIDEAGRGALAGPVAVGVAYVPRGFDWERIPDVRDSKQLSEARREAVYKIAQQLRREGVIDFHVALVSAGVIDRIGIVPAVSRGISQGLKKVSKEERRRVLLDGGLRAPDRYTNQETIIKGDQKEKVIALASVCAKVRRDRYMCQRVAKAYPLYAFETHKGYGTLLHRGCIQKHGLSDIHRRYFCTRIDVD